MAHVLTAIAVMAGMAALLAVLIIVADAVLLNYGECAITINGEEPRVVQGGSSLLASLMAHDIFIPSACGGRGSCGLCKLKVLEGGGPLLPTEAPHLTKEEIAAGVRLSCQVRVRSDMAIEVPEEILSVREFTGRVSKIAELNYDTRLLRIELEEPAEMSFRAGQYVQIETPPYGKTAEPVYRAYSIATDPAETGAFELVIRRVPNGICTTYVFEIMKEGDPVTFNGPYGEFYLRDTDAEVLFIAGGSGISPIRAILRRMAREGSMRKATFFYGANERRDLYMVEEMRALEEKIANFRYVPALARPAEGDGWDGEAGLVTEVIDRHVPDISAMEAYLCGSPGMIDACVKLLRSKGLTEDRIFFDKFA